jgi:hypothetical protein
MTTEFRVSVAYLGNVHKVRDYTVRAGDARVAASAGLKRFAKAPSYASRLYDDLGLRPGQSLTVVVTR